MEIQYLYIDDDNVKKSEEKIQGFEQEGRLKIITKQHKSTWEEQLKYIKENEALMDGLILDLRLDDYPNEDGKRADFRGTSLAQEIRTRQKEKDLKNFPIVLFSANSKLKQSLENSGKDLFDICLEKEVNAESFKIVTPQLISLAEGYSFLKENNDISKVLNIDIDFIDERFISELSQLLPNPPHVLSQFIINELIEKQGLLINERILAARLGLDLPVDSHDWEKIKDTLSFAKYKGVFAEGWERWWMPELEKWWNEVIESKTFLRSTPAVERVELIKKALNITDIKSAQKIDKAESEEFWTICKGYDKPLDPVDGLIIEGQEKLYPWQEPEYVSIDAALRGKNKENIWKGVAKIEEEHLKELQVTYKKVR